MKHFLFILFFLSVALSSYAVSDEIALNPSNKGNDRFDPPSLVDLLRAFCDFYDYGNQDVSIYGASFVSYYDVEISSAGTGNVEISTVVNGTYDTIDVSSLTTGSYVITIESPAGNIFEGTLTTY